MLFATVLPVLFQSKFMLMGTSGSRIRQCRRKLYLSSVGGPALAPATTSNLALLDAKLARYGAAPAAPELPANGLYQPTLQAPNMGYAPHLAAAPFAANGTGKQSLHHTNRSNQA